MSTSTLKQLPKSTIELEITIPWATVQESYKKIFEHVVKDTELPGFRKGKAPREMVEKAVDKTKVYQEVIKDVIPTAFSEAVKEHKLSPLTSPKIEVLEAKEEVDWKVKAIVALKPRITLGKYKEKIREAKKPTPKIWTPGKDMKKGEKEEDEAKKPGLPEVLTALLSCVEIELPDLIVEEETNKLLADLVDQTKKLGMTVEQYLMAKGSTSDQIQKEYRAQAERTLTIQFAIAEIADKEQITVSQKDIDDLIAKAEKPEERERLKRESYYLAHLLRQQKTLDFLTSL